MIYLAGSILVAIMVAVPAAFGGESPKVIGAVLTPATAAAVRGSEGGAGFALTGTPALERALTQAGVRQPRLLREMVERPDWLSAEELRTMVIHCGAGQASCADLAEALAAVDEVESFRVLEYGRTAMTPTDPSWAAQWNLNNSHLQAEAAWDVHTGSPNVILTVLDTGLDYEHPDLAGNVWQGTTPIGRDYCGNTPQACTGPADNDPQHVGGFTHSHGTKMAGVMAAGINNAWHVAGLAGGLYPSAGCQIWGLRAGYDMYNPQTGQMGGDMDEYWTLTALNAATNHYQTTGLPHVVNMSFNFPVDFLSSQVEAAWASGGVVMVAAARGESNDTPCYPAAYDKVVAVTGVDRYEVKGAASGYGAYVDLCAPVDGVPTVAYNASTGQHLYHETVGSTPSISAAQVSGVAGLVWSKYPALSNRGVVQQVVTTADSAITYDANPNYLGLLGKGRVNAYRALTEWSDTLFVRSGQTLVWSGTIRLTGDVVIPAGTTLQILPGTIVQASATSDRTHGGTYAGKVELIVHGTLDAQGVTFNSMEGAGAQWGGIFLNGGTTTLRGCSISNAVYGTRVATAGVTIGGDALSHGNTYTGCDYGVYVLNAAQTVIKNNTIAGGSYGIYLSGSSATVANNLLTNNGTYGILVGNQGAVTIQNNTLDIQVTNSATGIFVYNASNATIVNNIAQGFFNGGIRTDSTSSPGIVAQYYLSQGNGTGIPDLAGTLAATRRALFSDPRFLDRPGGDYRLNSSSPGRDLGDSSQTDPNGSRIDLGRYGGTALGDTAEGQVRIEDYFVNGGATGYQPLPGTVGTWSGDAAQGSYKVIQVNGVSQAYKQAATSSYTIETRLRFSSLEGKVIYTAANQTYNWRLDLMAGSGVRLITPDSSRTISMSIAANTWYNVRMEVSSAGINTWVNGTSCHQNFTLGGQIPDGWVGIGSYGSTHSAEFDYFVVYSDAPAGGVGLLVDDQFNDGSTAGWTARAGTWSEGSGYRAVSVDGVGWSHLSSSVSRSTYTIRTYLRFGGYEGKVIYHYANQDHGWRVDLMTSDYVRVITSQGASYFARTIDPNTWYLVEVEVNGSAHTINVWVNGQQCNSNVYMPATPDGWVGLGTYGPSHTAEFDYFQVFDGLRSAKPVVLASATPAGSAPRLASHPNPFNPSTAIVYQVRESGRVRLAVFDILGQQIRQLVDEFQESGQYQSRWDGTDEAGRPVVSGVYLCRLLSPGHREVRKMTLLR